MSMERLTSVHIQERGFASYSRDGLALCVDASPIPCNYWAPSLMSSAAESEMVARHASSALANRLQTLWQSRVTCFVPDLDELLYCNFGSGGETRMPLRYSRSAVSDANSPPAIGIRVVAYRNWKHEVTSQSDADIVAACYNSAVPHHQHDRIVQVWPECVKAVQLCLWRIDISLSDFCLAAYCGRSWWVPPLSLVNDLARCGVDFALEVLHCAATVCGRNVAVYGGEIDTRTFAAAINVAAARLNPLKCVRCAISDTVYSDVLRSNNRVVTADHRWAIHACLASHAVSVGNGLINSIAAAVLASDVSRTNEVVALHLLALTTGSRLPAIVQAVADTINADTGLLRAPLWGALEQWAVLLLPATANKQHYATLNGGVGRGFCPALSTLVPMWLIPEFVVDCGYTLQPNFVGETLSPETYTMCWNGNTEIEILRCVRSSTHPLEMATCLAQAGAARFLSVCTRSGMRYSSGPVTVVYHAAQRHLNSHQIVQVNDVVADLGVDTRYMQNMSIAVYDAAMCGQRWWSPAIVRPHLDTGSLIVLPEAGLCAYEAAGLRDALHDEEMLHLLAVCEVWPYLFTLISRTPRCRLAQMNYALRHEFASSFGTLPEPRSPWVLTDGAQCMLPIIGGASAVLKMILTGCRDQFYTASKVPESHGVCGLGCEAYVTRDPMLRCLFDASGTYCVDNLQEIGAVCSVMVGSRHDVAIIALTLPAFGDVAIGGWVVEAACGGEHDRGHCSIYSGAQALPQYVLPYCPGYVRLAGASSRARGRSAVTVNLVRMLYGTDLTHTGCRFDTQLAPAARLITRRTTITIRSRVTRTRLRSAVEAAKSTALQPANLSEILFGSTTLSIGAATSALISMGSGLWEERVSLVRLSILTQLASRSEREKDAGVSGYVPGGSDMPSYAVQSVVQDWHSEATMLHSHRTLDVPLEVTLMVSEIRCPHAPSRRVWCSWALDFKSSTDLVFNATAHRLLRQRVKRLSPHQPGLRN